MAVGVAKPKAQGQATTSTEMASFRASCPGVTGSDTMGAIPAMARWAVWLAWAAVWAAACNTAGNRSPQRAQKPKVNPAIAITPQQK